MHALIVFTVTFTFLLQPLPPGRRPWCSETIEVGHGLHYLLNVDSHAFLQLAENPRRLFENGGLSRQSRPVYIAAAWLLGPVVRDVPGLRAMNERRSYPGCIVLNFLTLIASLALFTKIVARSERGWVVATLVGVLLLANDVVKVFFWTAHQQLCNVLEPLLVAGLLLHVSQLRRLSFVRLVAHGLAGGMLMLAYGSFVLLWPALLAGLVVRARHGEPWPHATVGGALASLTFWLPTLAWHSYIRHTTGDFYLGETAEYRDFVWMLDAWRSGGVMQVSEVLREFTGMFLSTFSQEAIIPLFVAVTVIALRLTAWDTTQVVLRQQRPVVLACLVSAVLNFIFFWLLGNYAPRLTFSTLPALLAAAATLVAGVLDRQPKLTSYAITLLIAVAVVAAQIYVIMKPGPWC